MSKSDKSTQDWSSDAIRQSFLDFFEKSGHHKVRSSSLVPHNDPTLLFTNAGMVQFKDTFLGKETRPYSKATSIQRCVRAGGKHNDLENVGYTKRHHTFFEMLGNFSFGDYFKEEAIRFSWELLTEVFQIPAEKLWVTVYKKDPESEAIWLEKIGVDPKRFSRCGEKDNFWSMGETGPCGPCTEIFYDHGPEIAGGPPGTPEQEGDRYVEVWNLVFMQYNRDIKGNMTPLPKPCVDTGMGLERIAAVLQGVHDNYDTDTFQYLLKAISAVVGSDDFTHTSMRVIADHIRSTSFLIMDGVTPSNEERGYVLRRIIRRAIRHGFRLGQQQPFLYKLVGSLCDIMGKAYPDLVKAKTLIEEVIKTEEEQFATTLSHGLKIFDQKVADLTNDIIPGETVFTLYDTYGFPPDLTADIARERGLGIDEDGFEMAMAEQRRKSQASQTFNIDQTQNLYIRDETQFTGYESTIDEGEVLTLLEDNKPVNRLEEGQSGVVILSKTPFYAESGGQVGDSGYLYVNGGRFRVQDTKKYAKAYLHFGTMTKGHIDVGDTARAEVDETRFDTVLNHSATHLLHEALRRVLGEHVVQKGSLVEPKRLRFDFAHTKPLTQEELDAVERLVNAQIRANLPSTVHTVGIDEAKESGALALFGEKYQEQVRVVTMGEFSKEVCGGTHASRSGDIGFFKIVSETSVASGIRRIEALTGREAVCWVEQCSAQLNEVAALLKTKREHTIEKLVGLLEQNRELNKQLTQLKTRLTGQKSDSLIDQAKQVNGVNVLATVIPEADRDSLRSMLDQLKQQLKNAAIVLATPQDDKVILVAGLSKDVLSHFNATQLLNHVAQQVNGKGGGRPDFAQGGGDNSPALAPALASVSEWVQQQLKSE